MDYKTEYLNNDNSDLKQIIESVIEEYGISDPEYILRYLLLGYFLGQIQIVEVPNFVVTVINTVVLRINTRLIWNQCITMVSLN